MKKKIAILTQPLKGNYGGIVQNYALQEVLRREDFEVETIAREYGRDATALRRFLAHLKNNTYNWARGRKKKIFSKEEAEQIFAENRRFIKEYIRISPKLYDTNELADYFAKNKFDAVIVGSDQTWRPKYSPALGNYFLDFLVHDTDVYKMAYAASFGTDKWEFTDSETRESSDLIKTFDTVSVREKSGMILCRNFFNVEAEWVLDPTLLLTPDDYRVLYKSTDGYNNGVFSYLLDKDSTKKALVDNLADKLGVSVYSYQPKCAIEAGDIYDFDNLQNYTYPSPEGWLKSFDQADFVITDSFHGTVFAILFNKPFFAIVNDARGAARFHSLLQRLDLEDRLISDIGDVDLQTDLLNIDYKSVNNKLELWRAQSYDYLRTDLINRLNKTNSYDKLSV